MSDPTVIAHRGFAGVAPENTVRAFRDALESERTDATTIELDVQPAADGTPVVFHDERLEGDQSRHGRPLTDREGVVWEQPLETICRADVLESGETVPTLERVLEAVPSSAGVNVELKSPGLPSRDLRVGRALPDAERRDRREVWTPFVERVVADCEPFGGEVLFSSFCEGAIAAVREVAPEYAAAPLVGDSLADGLEIARRYDCEAIHPPKTAIAGVELSDEPVADDERPARGPERDVLEEAHAEGRAVNVWTVDHWVAFDRLAEAGVDGIVAAYPGLGGLEIDHE